MESTDLIGTLADAIAHAVAQRVERLITAAAPPPPTHGEWLKPTEAGDYVKLSYKRLEKLRHEGGGPAFERNGRRVRYAKSALDDWLTQRREARGAR